MRERKLTQFEINLARKSPKKFNQYMLDKLNAESEAEERAEKEKRIRILIDATEQDVEVSDVYGEIYIDNHMHRFEQKCLSVNGITFALLGNDTIASEIRDLERWLMRAAGGSREQVEDNLEKFHNEQRKIQKMHDIAYMINRAGEERIYMLDNPNFGISEYECPYIIYADRFEITKEKSYEFAKNAVRGLRDISCLPIKNILEHLYQRNLEFMCSESGSFSQINLV